MQAAYGLDAVGLVIPVGVVNAVQERGFGAFEEGPVVGAGAGGAADGDDAGDKSGEHAGPVVGLLGAHGKPNDGVEVGDVQVVGQEVVLGADAVAVVEGEGEGRGGGGAGGFAVAEHGDDDDVVGGEGAGAGGSGGRECEGGVDAAAVAGGD